MLIAYTSNDEVLVTTTKREKKMLKEWFEVDMGRTLDEYEREEHGDDSAVEITAYMRVI